MIKDYHGPLLRLLYQARIRLYQSLRARMETSQWLLGEITEVPRQIGSFLRIVDRLGLKYYCIAMQQVDMRVGMESMLPHT